MKKIFSIVLAVALATSIYAQAAVTVPQNVQDAFRSKYPNVTGVTWSEEQGYYKPSFSVGGAQTTAFIDLKGRLIQTITKISDEALPGAAAGYIKQNYSNAPVGDAGRIDFVVPAHASRFYAVVNGQTLVFDNKGEFVKVSTSPLKQ